MSWEINAAFVMAISWVFHMVIGLEANVHSILGFSVGFLVIAALKRMGLWWQTP